MCQLIFVSTDVTTVCFGFSFSCWTCPSPLGMGSQTQTPLLVKGCCGTSLVQLLFMNFTVLLPLSGESHRAYLRGTQTFSECLLITYHLSHILSKVIEIDSGFEKTPHFPFSFTNSYKEQLSSFSSPFCAPFLEDDFDMTTIVTISA